MGALLVALVTRRADAARTLVVWHAYRDAEERALDKVLADFRAAHPDAVVESLAIPFDAYASKLEAAIPHGHGPDVFIDAHERLGDYRARGLVAPIDPALVDRAAFDASALEAVSLDGKPYALPLALKCLALYLRAPTWPEGKSPASLDELLNGPGVRLAYEASGAYTHAPLLHAFGGRILDDKGRYAFADGPAVDSLTWVAAAVSRGAIPEEASGALVTQMFSSGSPSGADAAISGPWLAADLPKGIAYRVVPIPPVRAGGPKPRPFLTVEGAMIAPKPRDAALAGEMLKFLVATPSALVRAREGRQVVASRDAWTDPSVANDPLLRGFAEAARDAMPMPTSAAMRAAWEPTSRAIQKVLRGDVAPRAAMDEAAHRYADVTRPLPRPADPRFPLLLLGLVGLFAAFRAVRAARDPVFRAEARASLPAYAYVTHAVIIVTLLVAVPLVIGAATSFFAGRAGSLSYVGLANYVEILTARGGPIFASGSFYAVLAVTILWTVCNVTLHLALGVALALLLARPALRLRGVYRVLLIVPWAVPSYVSALAWKGMFHRQLGAVNAILKAIGVEPVAWFSKFATAFAANVATNVWLGFPFMMVVTLGALAAIPREVLEAAEVDGATRWQRFWRVTFPLLRPTLAPSVVLGAVWTFNMFNVVFLVSGGEPDGRTEILVSEAYRWAFTRQAQYGYASAYAVLIFLLLVVTTRLIRAQKEAA
ncbi:MAG: extracellular solute-binding protein [Deltaproteobacteria bacterium]|nr:extracellular solute-binding protein [Deltaproteobacteria bacterium]